MKILLCSEFYKPHIGGVEIHTEVLANYLSLNNQITIATTIDKNRKKISDIEYLKMSHVSQEVFMFDDTLINNICIPGDKKIDKILLKKVLKQSDLNDFVRKLPKGLYTNIGERGSKISGGQKQRIGIARALYRNNEILVLDEATSTLDIKTEDEILDTLSNLKKSKTIMIISHRNNTIKICDRVISLTADPFLNYH